MDITELQAKLTQLTQLLPSQRECLERLLFQLAFNQHKTIRIVGSVGSGKTVIALAMAELFSDQFNVALLDSKTAERDVSAQLMQQWFNRDAQSGIALNEQVEAATSVLPLLLIVDDADNLPASLLAQLYELDCLMFCFANQEGQNDDITLLLNRVTTEDANQLLHHLQLNEVDIAQRLASADGNIHVLLQNNTEEHIAVVPTQKNDTLTRYIPAFYIVAAVLIAFVLWLAFTGDHADDKTPAITLNSQPLPVQIPEPDEPLPTAELPPPDVAMESVEPEMSAADEAFLADTDTVVTGSEMTTETADSDMNQLADLPVATGIEPLKNDELIPSQSEEIDAPTTNTPPEQAYAYDESTLLAMNTQTYAIQLAVLSSDAAYQRFKRTYPELTVLAYSRSWQGQQQIVLLLASFDDKVMAKAKIKSLSPALIATGPFIKALQAVQTEIKVRPADKPASRSD